MRAEGAAVWNESLQENPNMSRKANSRYFSIIPARRLTRMSNQCLEVLRRRPGRSWYALTDEGRVVSAGGPKWIEPLPRTDEV